MAHTVVYVPQVTEDVYRKLFALEGKVGALRRCGTERPLEAGGATEHARAGPRLP